MELKTNQPIFSSLILNCNITFSHIVIDNTPEETGLRKISHRFSQEKKWQKEQDKKERKNLYMYIYKLQRELKINKKKKKPFRTKILHLSVMQRIRTSVDYPFLITKNSFTIILQS